MRKINIFKKMSEFIQKKKKPILAGTLAGVIMLTTGSVILLGGCSNKKNTSSETTKPSIQKPIEDSTDGTIETPSEPTDEPVVLSAVNIDKEILKIMDRNESNGFAMTADKTKSALFISNVDYLTTKDIYEMFGCQFDGTENQNTRLKLISEEIQNFYDYVSAVRTHNNNGNEYVSMAELIYDEEDKKIISELEKTYLELVDGLNNKTIKEEQFQKSFKYVTEFFTGAGHVTVDGKNYSNYSLTSGGGLVSEAYWPMFAVAYSSSNLLTSENKTVIKTLSEGTENQPAVVNGSKYLSSIISIVDSCTNEIITEEKQLVK